MLCCICLNAVLYESCKSVGDIFSHIFTETYFFFTLSEWWDRRQALWTSLVSQILFDCVQVSYRKFIRVSSRCQCWLHSEDTTSSSALTWRTLGFFAILCSQQMALCTIAQQSRYKILYVHFLKSILFNV